MAIVDVVKWDADGDQTYAWKFDSTELSTWTQLIVHESQEAVVFRGGAMDGPFGPGRHVLKTENLPILGKLLNLPFGRSPFTAEVWYTNRAIPLDVKWGTQTPIRLQDSKYGIMIPIGAHGQYAVQIENSRKFLVKLVGTMTEFSRHQLQDYFRGMILTIAKTVIAKKMAGSEGISLLDIATKLAELSEEIKNELQAQLAEFGLKLVNFFVNHIDVIEDDPSIQKLRDALAKRAEMNIVGFNYQQERSFNAMEGAAGFTAAAGNTSLNYKNETSSDGIANALVGAGIGLGAGVPIGSAVANTFGQMADFGGSKVQFQEHKGKEPVENKGLDHSEKIKLLVSLAELKEKGILSEIEFEIEKRKILGA